MIKKIAIIYMLTAVFLVRPPSALADSFFEELSKFFNLSLSSDQMKGPGDEVVSGTIWITDIESKITTQVEQEGGYRSPVFAANGTDLYVLKEDSLILIKSGKVQEELRKINNAVKLIGIDTKNPDGMLVLFEDEILPLGILSLKTGNISFLPYDPKSDDHRLALSKIQGQRRIMGDTRVFVKRESKRGLANIIEWTDVYVRRGDAKPQNVSGCAGIDCVQPALSPDGLKVVFVKADE